MPFQRSSNPSVTLLDENIDQPRAAGGAFFDVAGVGQTFHIFGPFDTTQFKALMCLFQTRGPAAGGPAVNNPFIHFQIAWVAPRFNANRLFQGVAQFTASLLADPTVTINTNLTVAPAGVFTNTVLPEALAVYFGPPTLADQSYILNGSLSSVTEFEFTAQNVMLPPSCMLMLYYEEDIDYGNIDSQIFGVPY